MSQPNLVSKTALDAHSGVQHVLSLWFFNLCQCSTSNISGRVLLDGCQPDGCDELSSGLLVVALSTSAASVSSAKPYGTPGRKESRKCHLRWLYGPARLHAKGSAGHHLGIRPECHTFPLNCCTKRCMLGPCASEASRSPVVAACSTNAFVRV